eukprot:COSAG05_NODE_1463_length_4810_cov_8.316706_3_plen_170_part_00
MNWTWVQSSLIWQGQAVRISPYAALPFCYLARCVVLQMRFTYRVLRANRVHGSCDSNCVRAVCATDHNDFDMLEVGNGNLSPEEEKAHFGLWCLMSSPLLAGNNLSAASPALVAILTAKGPLAINQDPLALQGQLCGSGTDGADGLWQVQLAVQLLYNTYCKALPYDFA